MKNIMIYIMIYICLTSICYLSGCAQPKETVYIAFEDRDCPPYASCIMGANYGWWEEKYPEDKYKVILLDKYEHPSEGGEGKMIK